MSTDYYDILGVAPSASADEIKRLYKKLAVKFHPDKTDDPSLHKKFIMINEAYETLKDSDLRESYNSKNGISKHGYTNNYPLSARDSFKSHHGYTYFQSTTSRTSGPSYFNWHQLNARAYTDAYNRSARQEQEDAATLAANLARKKMMEDLERRKREYMAEAQKVREREMRERLEKDLWEQRARSRRAAETHVKDEYDRAKQRAHQNLWHGSYPVEEDDIEVADDELPNGAETGPGHDSTQPIIVEDEEEGDFDEADESADEDEDESENFEDCQSAPPTSNFDDPNESINQETEPIVEDNGSDDSLHGAPQTPQDGPEVVEVPEEHEHSTMNNMFSALTPLSPQRKQYRGASSRAKSQARAYMNEQHRLREELENRQRTSAKKPKFADMSEMRDSLGTNLDDVSFEDLRDNLPEMSLKTRKASGSIQSSSKRPRVTEYTDGHLRAQTLFTPINRSTARFSNSTILPSDLAPSVNENSLMFTALPPKIEVSLSLTHTQWDAYVDSIQAYERQFAKYREAVFKYQMGRLEKDERHHNIIYSDVSCLDVYNTCLFNDMLIVQNYHRTLQEFRETLKAFKRNCEVVNNMQTQGNV